MEASGLCDVPECGAAALERCARCDRALCQNHVVRDYSHLPGGQRPYCPECDAERRRVYRTTRTLGLRAIVWSGAGAVVGSSLGYLAGALVTAESFTHTVTTDVGFVAGLAGALIMCLKRANPRT
jgi:hypothetical protein